MDHEKEAKAKAQRFEEEFIPPGIDVPVASSPFLLGSGSKRQARGLAARRADGKAQFLDKAKT